jgi:hypothetical protein
MYFIPLPGLTRKPANRPHSKCTFARGFEATMRRDRLSLAALRPVSAALAALSAIGDAPATPAHPRARQRPSSR